MSPKKKPKSAKVPKIKKVSEFSEIVGKLTPKGKRQFEKVIRQLREEGRLTDAQLKRCYTQEGPRTMRIPEWLRQLDNMPIYGPGGKPTQREPNIPRYGPQQKIPNYGHTRTSRNLPRNRKRGR